MELILKAMIPGLITFIFVVISYNIAYKQGKQRGYQAGLLEGEANGLEKYLKFIRGERE